MGNGLARRCATAAEDASFSAPGQTPAGMLCCEHMWGAATHLGFGLAECYVNCCGIELSTQQTTVSAQLGKTSSIHGHLQRSEHCHRRAVQQHITSDLATV